MDARRAIQSRAQGPACRRQVGLFIWMQGEQSGTLISDGPLISSLSPAGKKSEKIMGLLLKRSKRMESCLYKEPAN
jgi:hypothetical protein